MSLPRAQCMRVARMAAMPCSRRTFTTASSLRATYGFVGLGRMGFPMARNLRSKISKRDNLVVFDVNHKAMDEFLEVFNAGRETRDAGKTTEAEDVRQLAEQSDVIITSLPEPSHVRAVFDKILSTALPPPPAANGGPRLYIDCSTIDPITSRAIAAEVSAANAGVFVDAPMSGGVVGAEAAALTFMLGAPDSLVQRVTDVLSLMGKRVVHLGDQGAGLCGKLANNYLLALNNIATAEAMSMGIKWGLNPKALADMINTSTGRCWPSEVNNPVAGIVSTAPASRGYVGGFGISLMAKDLRLALTACEEYGVKLGLGGEAKKVYSEAEQDPRCKGKDFSSIYLWLDGPAK